MSYKYGDQSFTLIWKMCSPCTFPMYMVEKHHCYKNSIGKMPLWTFTSAWTPMINSPTPVFYGILDKVYDSVGYF